MHLGRRIAGARASCGLAFDGDGLLLLELGLLLLLGHVDLEHAVLEACLDVVFLDIVADVERAAALAAEALLTDERALLVLVLGFALRLSGDAEVAVLQISLDVVLLEAGQIDG